MRHVRSEKERFDAFKMFRGFPPGASSGFLAVHKKVHKQHKHMQTSNSSHVKCKAMLVSCHVFSALLVSCQLSL